LSVHRCVRGRLLSIPIVKRIRFAAYIGALSGGVVLAGLIIYFLAYLREPYAAFEVRCRTR
jgi:hypothetical protein